MLILYLLWNFCPKTAFLALKLAKKVILTHVIKKKRRHRLFSHYWPLWWRKKINCLGTVQLGWSDLFCYLFSCDCWDNAMKKIFILLIILLFLTSCTETAVIETHIPSEISESVKFNEDFINRYCYEALENEKSLLRLYRR